MNQSHFLFGLALYYKELDDAGRLVDVQSHGVGQGKVDIHILAVVPDLVAGPRPANTPGAIVLP